MGAIGVLQALIDYTRVLELDSNNTKALDGRGSAYNYLSQFEKAIQDFDRVLELEPSAISYWHRGITLMYEIIECTTRMEQCHLATREIDRDIAQSIARSIVLGASDSTKRASKTLIEPCRSILWRDSRSRIADSPRSRSVEILSHLIEQEPNAERNYHHRGRAYRALGRWEEAIADHSKALSIDGRCARAFAERGYARLCAGQHDLAEEDFAQAISIVPARTLLSNQVAHEEACIASVTLSLMSQACS